MIPSKYLFGGKTAWLFCGRLFNREHITICYVFDSILQERLPCGLPF